MIILPVFYWLIIAAILVVVARKTPFGRHVYAIGSNERAARLSGINVERVKALVYVLSGLLVAVAAVINVARIGSMDYANAGSGYEMDAIAASIIGGTLLTGGVGNVIGTFFGALILATIQKIIALSPLNESWWQEMANGAMLGLFILLQSVILGNRGKHKKADFQTVQKE